MRKMQAVKAGSGAPAWAPLSATQALECRGGGDVIEELLRLLPGAPPDPDQWPPMKL